MCYDLNISLFLTYPVLLFAHHVRSSSQRSSEKFTRDVGILCTSLNTDVVVLKIELGSEPFFVPLHRKLGWCLISVQEVHVQDLGFGSLERVEVLLL